MANRELVERIVEYHKREAEDEYCREVGTDFYDKITWDNIEPFLPKEGWILDAGGGVGVWSRKMVETGKCKVELLDITGESLKMAKKRINNDGGLDNALKCCMAIFYPFHTLTRVLILFFLKGTQYPSVETEDADFDSKSFTPLELMSLLQKHSLKTVRIVGKPIGVGIDMTDIFIEALPIERRRQIFENKKETEELSNMLNRIFSDPYIAGIGSHLQIVAIKEEN